MVHVYIKMQSKGNVPLTVFFLIIKMCRPLTIHRHPLTPEYQSVSICFA